jgi:hypothetical protein
VWSSSSCDLLERATDGGEHRHELLADLMAGGDEVQHILAELGIIGVGARYTDQRRDGLRIDREAIRDVRSRAEPLEVLIERPARLVRRPHSDAAGQGHRTRGRHGKRHTGAPHSAAEGVGDGWVDEEGG